MTLNSFDTNKMFECENGYYATIIEDKLEKFLAHCELNKKIMKYKNLINYEFVKIYINKTIPKYCKNNTQLKIELLHIGTDVYEPAVTILENMYDKVVRGGIIMSDDYGMFFGGTKIVDEFLANKDLIIQKLPISHASSFVVKS